MSKRPIEHYVRAQAAILYQLGLNLLKISKLLQFSRSCVRNAVIIFEEYAKVDNMKRSARPKSLSDRNVRELKRLVQSDHRLSEATITTELNMSVSKRTVRRYLKKFSCEYAVKIEKQWLSAKHRKVLVQRCERHQH